MFRSTIRPGISIFSSVSGISCTGNQALATDQTRIGGRRRQVSLPPEITAAFDALTTPGQTTATAAPSASRPLLNLFPDPAVDTRPQPAVYETFYGLQEQPFALSADPRFFYHSTPHDTAGQRLLTAIREREGLVLITGPAGVGKTMVCRWAVEQLDLRTLTSFVDHPVGSASGLLMRILADFGVLSRADLARGEARSPRELMTALQAFVDSSLVPLQASGCIIIDNAHTLGADVLEQARVLADAAFTSRQFQIILVGEPALADMLRRPEHRALRDHVAVSCTVDPIPADELEGYIYHRLGVAWAGATSRLEFHHDAIARIHALSRGVPRVINQLCDRVLAHGRAASASVVTTGLVQQAAEDLSLEGVVENDGIRAGLDAAVTFLFFMFLGGAAATWVFRDQVARTIAHWQQVQTQK